LTCLFFMNTRLKPLAALLPALFSIAPAGAQQAAVIGMSADGASILPSITVYASRFEEKLADALPQTSILTAAEIQKSGASNVSEVLSKVAGLPMKINLDGSTNAVVDMRGYGDTASNNVVVLLDGVRLSENEQTVARTSMIPLEAIDHIEITKTGNSVLYGDGATSGTINIVTRKNVGNLTVVSGGLASYSGYQSGIYHSQALESGELSLFARQYASDNYRHNANGSELSAGANWIRHIDAQTDIGARFFASEERNKLPGALPSIYLNSAPRDTQVPGYNYDANVDSKSLTLFAKKTMGDVELAVDLNKRVRDNADAYSYDAHTVYSGYNKYADWHHSYSNSNAHSEVGSISPRVKINNFLSVNNTLQMGYDWLKSTKSGSGYKTDSMYNIDDPSDPWYYWPHKIDNSNYQLAHRTSGVYLRDIFDITATDRVVLGYRKTRYSQNHQLNYYNDNDPAINPGTSTYVSEGTAAASELEYTKKFQPNVLGYARLSRNFRIANADDNSARAWGADPLTVQTSSDLDVGVNYRSDNASTEFGYFRSNVKNEIGYDPEQGGNVNYDPTKREGLNLRQRLALSKLFAVRANLQYVNARFVEGSHQGKNIPGVAPFSGNISLDYQLGPKQQITLTSRFADSRYMSGDFDNRLEKVSGYVVEDLSYFYKEKNWSVVATVINITDKKYATTGIYNPSYLAPYKLTVYPNPGRSFSLTGRYTF